jgi:hypothetical protein
MGRVLLLPAAIFGPVASFAKVLVAIAGWWPPVTGILDARILAIVVITR